MSFYDNLPKLQGAAGSVADKIVNYATASVQQILAEGNAKITSTVGAVKNFIGGAAVGVPPITSAVAALPTTSVSAAAVNEAVSDGAPLDTSHKVKLTANAADGAIKALINDPSFPVETLSELVVEFDATPEVSENRTVEYEAVSAPQMPGEFQKYKGTKSVIWQIMGVFSCRTRAEAKRNYLLINTLRAWSMPYFGEKQRSQFQGKLGAPPPVLLFSGWRGLVGEVPVVVTQVAWQWPKDCDWIPTGITRPNGEEVPFPTVMNVTVSLVESFSPEQVNSFDLVSFRNGNMVGAWNWASPLDQSPPVSQAIGGQQGITNGTPTPTGNDAGTPPTEATTTAVIAAERSNVSSGAPTATLNLSARTIVDSTKNTAALDASISTNTAVLAAQTDVPAQNATQAIINSDMARRQRELAKIAKQYNLDITSTAITQ